MITNDKEVYQIIQEHTDIYTKNKSTFNEYLDVIKKIRSLENENLNLKNKDIETIDRKISDQNKILLNFKNIGENILIDTLKKLQNLKDQKFNPSPHVAKQGGKNIEETQGKHRFQGCNASGGFLTAFRDLKSELEGNIGSNFLNGIGWVTLFNF